MRHTLIIGAGAAGMAAAIAAAKKGDRVTVLERNRKPMKKLGVTGNGRGNLLNCGKPEFFGDTAFALDVLQHMPYKNLVAFLNEAGIPLVHEDEGRMYPSSFLAASAVDALKLTADMLGVEIIPNVRAEHIVREKDGFCVQGKRAVYAPDQQLKSGRVKAGALMGEEACAYRADRVIVAAGGKASPMHGTDGTAYGLLTGHGHQLTQLKPALCALLTDQKPLEGLTGQRVRALLTLKDAQGDILHQSRGEALFADDGVSGIAAMQLSRFAQDGCTLEMDLRMAVTGDENCGVHAWLQKRAERVNGVRDLLTGACTYPLAQALWRMSGTKPSMDSLDALANAIQNFRLSVTGTRGFDNAQVTAGGLETAGFDPSTMESRLVPGLYAAGEMLNVDGGCGGHNLMFAFASGLLAGQA